MIKLSNECRSTLTQHKMSIFSLFYLHILCVIFLFHFFISSHQNCVLYMLSSNKMDLFSQKITHYWITISCELWFFCFVFLRWLRVEYIFSYLEINCYKAIALSMQNKIFSPDPHFCLLMLLFSLICLDLQPCSENKWSSKF